MADDTKSSSDVYDQGIKELLKTPALIAPLLFMLLCGYVISFLLFQTNTKFTKHVALTKTVTFNLAVGFVSSSVIIIIYHLIAYKRMVATTDDMANVALPCTLILAGLTFILVLIRVIKK